MKYYTCYDSPIGELLIITDEKALKKVAFDFKTDEKNLLREDNLEEGFPAIMVETIDWLDKYFEGQNPGPIPAIDEEGTEFQKQVWDILVKIPYGETTTYGEIARKLAQYNASGRMSAQAVGQAVGKNPIPILVPCHRVLGAGRRLGGYGGGMERKKFFLYLEQITFYDNKEGHKL